MLPECLFSTISSWCYFPGTKGTGERSQSQSDGRKVVMNVCHLFFLSNLSGGEKHNWFTNDLGIEVAGIINVLGFF